MVIVVTSRVKLCPCYGEMKLFLLSFVGIN